MVSSRFFFPKRFQNYCRQRGGATVFRPVDEPDAHADRQGNLPGIFFVPIRIPENVVAFALGILKFEFFDIIGQDFPKCDFVILRFPQPVEYRGLAVAGNQLFIFLFQFDKADTAGVASGAAVEIS